MTGPKPRDEASTLSAIQTLALAMNDLMSDPEPRRAAIAFITEGLAGGRLKPVVDRVFPLEEIVDAHRRLESNLQLGKILVAP